MKQKSTLDIRMCGEAHPRARVLTAPDLYPGSSTIAEMDGMLEGRRQMALEDVAHKYHHHRQNQEI